MERDQTIYIYKYRNKYISVKKALGREHQREEFRGVAVIKGGPVYSD